MDDKMLELLEKMYNEFSNLKKDMSEFREENNKRMDRVEGHITRLENKFDNHSKALFDGYKQHCDQLTRVEEKLEDLTGKVEQHDLKLHAIES